MNTEWWREPFRTFQTNLREVDAGLDVHETLGWIEEYGADTWLLSVGGIIANYPSRLDCQTVNPALAERSSGDLVRDVLDASAKRGIRVLGRMDFSKIDARRAEEHPEWCFVSPRGEQQIYNGYRSVCPSGEYYQRHMFDVVEEVLARYDLSGFFFNWMSFNERDYSKTYWGVCHCEPCLEGFGQRYPGVEHPTGPTSTGYAEWKEFSCAVLDDLHARMRAHIERLQPGVALILGDRADITFYEANNAVGRPLWHFQTAEEVSAAKSADPERPVFVNAVGFVDMPYRWAGEDPHHFVQYLLQAVAHGAQPSTYIMGTPEHSQYRALDAGRNLTRFHRNHSDLYRGMRSAARTAVVRRSSFAGSQGERAAAEFRGVYTSLVERHVPFDVVRQEALPEADLARYDLVILPDLGELAQDQLHTLRTALEAQSAVVVTGSSAWESGNLQLLEDDRLLAQREYFDDEEALRSLHIPVGGPSDLAPVIGSFRVLEPGPGAETDWHLLGRALYGPPEKCYGHPQTSHPGWVSVAAHGGALGVLPWAPGLVYRELGLAMVRDAWVDKALALSRNGRQIVGDLPEQVHVVLGESASGTVIHLLNRSGDKFQRFAPPVPLSFLTFSIPLAKAPTGVRACVSEAGLQWRWSEGWLVIEVPAIGLFEVIVVSP